MNTIASIGTERRRHQTTYRWIRQLHLWIGAWGALAAVIYGFTGLVMNHRFGDAAWPQGDSTERGRTTLQVPAEARATPEQLSLWLRSTRHLDADVIRKGPGGRDTKASKQPAKWTFSGGTASEAWSLEYAPGSDTAEMKRSSHTLLAAFNRLHKGVGGGMGWRILADTFAFAMLLLGMSGLWMWARGRTLRSMVVSVMGASVAALLVVLVPALL